MADVDEVVDDDDVEPLGEGGEIGGVSRLYALVNPSSVRLFDSSVFDMSIRKSESAISLPVESELLADGDGVLRLGLNEFASDFTSLLKKSVRKSSGLMVLKSSVNAFRSTDSSEEQLNVGSVLMERPYVSGDWCGCGELM